MIPWPRVTDPRAPFPEPQATSDHRFRALLEQLWVDPTVAPLVFRAARARGVDRPLLAHKVPLPVVDSVASEATLVRIATDMDPACGSSGPDMVLGPLADEVQDRRTLQVAVALATFFAGDDGLPPTWRRWRRSTPAPRRDVRAGVHAIAMAPLAPWRVHAIRGEQVVLEDVLGLSHMVCPTGPVTLRPVATPLGPLEVGGLLVARVARQGRAWVATCPIAVPGPIPGDVHEWMRWMGWEMRLTFRGPVTRTMLLARRGHVLVRRLLEGAWLRA